MNRFTFVLAINGLLLSAGGAQTGSENGFRTAPGLNHLSIWTAPTPAPDSAFAALLMSAVRMAAYCEPLALQPPFQSDITGYEAEFPGDVDLNVLAAAPAGASIQMSLTTASGDALPIVTADGVSGDMNGVSISIPRVSSLARQITGGLNVAGMPVGVNTLEIRVSDAEGDASRSYVFQLNRLAPAPDAEGDPECPEPSFDDLLDAVAEMEPERAQ